MKTKLLIILIGAFSHACIIEALDNLIQTHSSMLIYGKITTVDDEVYQGQIRWGKEEVYWFDFFNSQKPKNDNLKWLDDDEIKVLNEKDHNHNSNNGWLRNVSWNNNNGNSDHTHLFACQFGDIKSLKVSGSQKVNLELKNGDVIFLKGGSNDIGASVNIHDEDLGHVKMKWNRIKKVDFMSAPSDLENAYGEPLFGTVETDRASFTGYIQWDHDERASKDELNGDYDDGSLDIAFGNIQEIVKKSRGSEVTLNSGRNFYLKGSNDVNDSNRGIVVNMPGFGRVDINWDEFEKVSFEEVPRGMNSEITYNSFKGDQKISGTVTTIEGKRLSGELVYDLDECYQLELLDGVIDEIEYFIPFDNISEIKSLNREESEVTIKSGERLTMEDKVDIDERNDGVLVFNGTNDYQYISWKKIEKINFD